MLRSLLTSAIMIGGLCCLGLGLYLCIDPAQAAVPDRISYQGYLEEDTLPVHGTRDLRFVLYGTSLYPDSLWSESHPGVTVDRGVFSVQLGSVQPLTTGVLQREAIYLETQVNGITLAPRKRLDAVPYARISTLADSAAYAVAALNAQYAETAATAAHATSAETADFALHAAYADSAGSGGGGGSSSYWGPNGSHIYNLNSGSVGIGTNAPERKLHVVDNSTFPAAQIRNDGSGPALSVSSSSGAGTGLQASANGTAVSAWSNGTIAGVGVFGGADAASGHTIGVSGYAASPDGRGVSGQVVGAGGYGVFGEAAAAGGYGVAGRNLDEAGPGVGVLGTSAGANGIGVRGEGTGPMGMGVSGSGATAGVYGETTIPIGRGVHGHGEGTGVYGTADGSSSYGVLGVTTGINSFGVYGSTTQATGTGVYGNGGLYGGRFMTFGSGAECCGLMAEAISAEARAVSALASGSGATGVYAEASDQASSNGAGGHFVSRGGGAAVIGHASNIGSEANYGGYFTTAGSDASGLVGVNTSYLNDTPGVRGEHRSSDSWGIGVRGDGNYQGVAGYAYGGTNAGPRYGVYGRVEGATTTGISYGVYGTTSGSGTRYGGYFNGNVHVTGILSKGGGSFKIDHPLDPANKYLLHSFVESPDMMNVYNGNTVLDGLGEAVVTLPDWFETLNRDFRYQLTCIGGFAPVYISEKVRGNQFRIAGGTSGLEVSWQLTGIRQDAFANAHRIEVEVEKPDEERGTYLFPVEHGMPADLQTDQINEERSARLSPVVAPEALDIDGR